MRDSFRFKTPCQNDTFQYKEAKIDNDDCSQFLYMNMNSQDMKFNHGLAAFKQATQAVDFFSPLKQRRA